MRDVDYDKQVVEFVNGNNKICIGEKNSRIVKGMQSTAILNYNKHFFASR